MRSGWYAAWMDDCDLPQQLPLDWNDDWSPSTLIARPFCTVTHTPHSIFPQPRQHVRTRFTSSPRAAAPASSASAAFGATAAAQANAAPVTAVSFVNARRVRLSFPIPPPSPSRPSRRPRLPRPLLCSSMRRDAVRRIMRFCEKSSEAAAATSCVSHDFGETPDK